MFSVKQFCFAILHHREIVCCLPSFNRHLLVGLLHFGLRPVQQDRLRICPLQCRQRQQNISLTCAHKAGLSFAKILNWDGLSRQMSEPKWTKSKLRRTCQRSSSTTEGWAKIGQADCILFGQEIGKDRIADHVIFHTKYFENCMETLVYGRINQIKYENTRGECRCGR